MQEDYEFRLFPNAGAIIVNEPLKKGSVSVVVRGRVGDEQYVRIEQLHKQLRQRGEAGAFAGWLLNRRFSATEKEKANAFWVDPPIQNVSLEESGTHYDEDGACQECGIGGFPVAPIVVRSEGFKGQDVVRLLSGEILISERFLKLLQDAGCSGCDALPTNGPVRKAKGRSQAVDYWLLSARNLAQIDQGLTRFGADPFDLERRGSCKCAAGEIAGYAPISALTITGALAHDVALSDVYVGTRRGLLRPYRLLLLSKRIFQLAQAAKFRGLNLEPVL